MSRSPDAAWMARLCRWYRAHRRDLPWRRNANPYRIWISEAMLQQTQVATVIPYFQRWLDHFPDLPALAAADEQDVLKAWEGLGYYSRARQLHRAARLLVERHGGRLPETAAELLDLPGIGEYTAAAIASIAFGEPVPVVDGNVRRVMARLLAIDADPRRPAAEQAMRAVLAPLLHRFPPSDANQALMELGALVCTPRNPRCADCPAPPQCRAHREGRTGELPVRQSRPPTPHHHVAVALVERRGRILLVQRPADGLLGGLWELPGGRLADPAHAARDLAALAKAKTGLDITLVAPLPAVRHAFSHFSVTLHPWRCEIRSGRLRNSPARRPGQWAPRHQLPPLPRAVAKILVDAAHAHLHPTAQDPGFDAPQNAGR